MSANAKPTKDGLVVFQNQLQKMEEQFAPSLPAHITPQKFKQTVVTAANNNPKLLFADRTSFWTAAMRAAQDGLLPDGREGAMVIRWSNKGDVVAWQPMIAGIRKMARNSGEIATWDVDVVYENDDFEIEKGDHPRIYHRPAMKNRGAIVGAYSVCTLKSGEKSREFMPIEEIHEIRDKYSEGWKAFKQDKIKSTPWSTSEGEMCKKTVARRHAKVLPMSTDIMDLLLRSDDDPQTDTVNGQPAPAAPKTLTQRLDQLAGMSIVDETTGEVIEHDPREESDANSQAASGSAGNDPSTAEGKDAGASPSHEASASKPKSDPKADKAPDRKAALNEILRRGDDAASRGREKLDEFTDSLTGDEQALLSSAQGQMKKWRAIAAEADKAEAE